MSLIELADEVSDLHKQASDLVKQTYQPRGPFLLQSNFLVSSFQQELQMFDYIVQFLGDTGFQLSVLSASNLDERFNAAFQRWLLHDGISIRDPELGQSSIQTGLNGESWNPQIINPTASRTPASCSLLTHAVVRILPPSTRWRASQLADTQATLRSVRYIRACAGQPADLHTPGGLRPIASDPCHTEPHSGRPPWWKPDLQTRWSATY